MSNTVYVNNLTALGGSGTINVKSGTAIKGDGGAILTPGLVTQVKFKYMNPSRLSLTGDAMQLIPGTEMDFRCFRGSSKVLLRATISSNSPYVTSFGFFVDNQQIFDATGNSNANNAIATVYERTGGAPPTTGYLWYGGTTATAQTNSRNTNSANQGNMKIVTIQYLYTPGDGGLRTYSLGATCSWGGQGGYALIINDRWDYDMRSISTFSAMELSQT